MPPLPTLSPDEAKDFVMDLLEGNGDCQLPCWWGITPGKTSWQEAERFLSSFALAVGDFWDKHLPDYQSVKVVYSSPVAFPERLDQEYRIRDGMVIAFSTYNYEVVPTLYLNNVLANYGQPDVVSLFTEPYEDMGSRPTGYVIFYQQKGILIMYAGAKRVENVGDTSRICPSGTYNFLYVWDPSLDLSYEEALDWFDAADGFYKLIQLEEASNMSVAEFYETYQNPDSTICIDTPLQLWLPP